MEDDQRQRLNVTEKRYRSFPKILFMVINLCLSPFYFGYSLGYFGSFEFSSIVNIFNVTMDQNLAQSLLQGLVPIGGGIGALSSSLMLKKFSRRNCVLVVNAAAFIVGVLILIPNFGLLFFCRFIQGICVGLYSSLIPLIIKQFAPTQISGTLGALNQFSIAFGVFFAYFAQYIAIQINTEEEHWRFLFGLPLVTLLIQTILLLFVYKYQTPRYLLQKNQQQSCRKTLEFIYKEQYIDSVLAQKRIELNPNKQSLLSQSEQTTSPSSSKSYKFRTFLAIHLAVLQQFVGINSIVAYGQQIAAAVFPDLSQLIPVILNFEQVLTSLLTSYLLSKLGRKVILQVGTLIFVGSLLFISVGFFIKDSAENASNVLVLIGLFVFTANFGLSLGPIIWLYIPQIVTPNIVPFSTLANWASASLVIICFPLLKSAMGTPAPLFLFFCIWSLVSFFIDQKYVIETKGKTQPEIFAEYDKMV